MSSVAERGPAPEPTSSRMTSSSVSSVTSPSPRSVTVAVVAICGAQHISRCLDALGAQRNAPAFDVVVVYDPHLSDVPALHSRYPHARTVANEGQRTPLELAARAIHESHGELILLTEDHCIPDRDWVRTLCDAQRPDRAAVGGAVETDTGASPVDWAFYYVDFFRYMSPVQAGSSRTLTVCNVSYQRSRLVEIAPLWQHVFHETAINDALRARFGTLWLLPQATVRMRRTVRFADAIYERYAFGRLFGCTRLSFSGPGRRLYYSILAPALPFLLLGRMTRKALKRPAIASVFVRAIPALVAMVLAWSWGEWLGYLTNRRSRSLVVAPEIRVAARA